MGGDAVGERGGRAPEGRADKNRRDLFPLALWMRRSGGGHALTVGAETVVFNVGKNRRERLFMSAARENRGCANVSSQKMYPQYREFIDWLNLGQTGD